MKQVPLMTVPADFSPMGGEKDQEVDYAESMLEALRRPKDPKAATSPGEMRVALPIMDKIDRAVKSGQDYVLLEDADHKEINERLANFPFAFNHQVILDMCDAIKNAPEATVVPVEEAAG